MENKICVYAICKNEIQFVNQWLDSMSEADYIVVLDTGSTDGTFEALSADPRVTRVEKKKYKQFRFDVARNDSMRLCPDDANILVCTDFDEVFTPGWAENVRQGWTEVDTRGFYKYAWSHNDIGEPTDVFIYDKMHIRNYHWIYPVHEILAVNDDINYENQVHFGNIMLHHWQDKTKKRSNYLKLLEISVKENPNSAHCQYLLAREYMVQNFDEEKILAAFQQVLDMRDAYTEDSKLILIDTYIKMAEVYTRLHDFSTAVMYYQKCLELDKTYREPYFGLAEIYNELQHYNIALGFLADCELNTVRKFDWVEKADSWICKLEDIRSISEFYIGDVDGAIRDAREVAAHNPNDLRILKNLNYFLLFKLDNITEKEGGM